MGSGEGDGGQNRMSDEKVETEVGGGGGGGAGEKSEEAGKAMRHTVAERLMQRVSSVTGAENGRTEKTGGDK